MSENDGLICAFCLDGQGGGRLLDWPDLPEGEGAAGPIWIHLDRSKEPARSWLRYKSGLDPLVCEALLAEGTRPRCDAFGEGRLLILRGVNLNPGAEPEDMVTLRLWADRNRIISLRRRRVMAVDDLRVALGEGCGPMGVPGLVNLIAAKLVERADPFLEELEDGIVALEEEVLRGEREALRHRLHDFRHQAITLRRYIAPQRLALARMVDLPPDWFGPVERNRLRETNERIMRSVEDLDTARERAAVIQDELATRLSELMNRRMFLLSVVAGIFLPLSFVTGVLGMNTAGMPGSDWPFAFAIVAAALAVLGVFEMWLFRRLGWL